MQTREAADLRHLKQVARGLCAAGLYANYRDALVKADEVRRRAEELQIAWADEPQPRLLRFRAMLRRVLDGGHLGSRYLRARNVRAGHFAPSFARQPATATRPSTSRKPAMNTQARTAETAAALIACNWTKALVAFKAADAAHDAQGRRWQAAYDAGEDDAHLDDACGVTYDAREVAYEALLATQPPNVAALAAKLALHAQRSAEDGASPDWAADGYAQLNRDAAGLAALAA